MTDLPPKPTDEQVYAALPAMSQILARAAHDPDGAVALWAEQTEQVRFLILGSYAGFVAHSAGPGPYTTAVERDLDTDPPPPWVDDAVHGAMAFVAASGNGDVPGAWAVYRQQDTDEPEQLHLFVATIVGAAVAMATQ